MVIPDLGASGAIKRVLKKGRKKKEEEVELPTPPKIKVIETAPPKEEEIKTFKDVETGEISGFTDRKGRTILGEKRDILKAIGDIKKRKLEEAEILKGTVSPEEQQRRQAAQELVQQIGEQPFQQPTEAEPLSQEQAITQAALAAGPAALTAGATAGIGSLLIPGAAPAAPAIALVAGAGTFALTFFNAYKGNLNQQRKDNIRGRKIVLAQSRQNLVEIVNYVNAGGDPVQASQDFNDQLSIIQQQYSSLHLDARASPLTISQDATTELIQFEFFYAPGGARENVVREMQIALLNPNPQKIISVQQEAETE